MARSESSGGGATAIVAIVLMLLIAGFIAWRMGVFGGNSKSLDINVNTPSSK